MSQYVTTENQKLLWNVISKNPIVNDYFLNNPYKKDEWFKSIIRMFYDKNAGRLLNQTDLLMLNKTTISYMNQNVKELTGQSMQKPTQTAPIQLDQNFLKPYSITENKVEKIGNQFEQKQVEYNSLFDRKVPEAPEFSEKQDKPLSNMDELIQQHLREREEELRKYAPLPLSATPIVSQPNKLRIEQSPDTINIQIEEISQPDISDKLIKTVSWSDTVNAEKLESQQKEIDELKSQVAKLIMRLTSLEETNNNK
uniref:Uncharacterized protein n=1 Tax=viral metagenome TaxID=1070528 RepID=A0A6C0L888_9ZZZZ